MFLSTDLHHIRYFVDMKIIRGESYDADFRLSQYSQAFYLSNPLLDLSSCLKYFPGGLSVTLQPVIDQRRPGGRYDPSGPGAR